MNLKHKYINIILLVCLRKCSMIKATHKNIYTYQEKITKFLNLLKYITIYINK